MSYVIQPKGTNAIVDVTTMACNCHQRTCILTNVCSTFSVDSYTKVKVFIDHQWECIIWFTCCQVFHVRKNII
jgi:hypothetical protein